MYASPHNNDGNNDNIMILIINPPIPLSGASRPPQYLLFLHAPHDGPVPGHRGPLHCCTARRDQAGAHHPTTQPPQGQYTVVNQLLSADSIPGCPRPVGCPHYTWMDGAMQDLSTPGPLLQQDLLQDWPKLAQDRDLWRGVAGRC